MSNDSSLLQQVRMAVGGLMVWMALSGCTVIQQAFSPEPLPVLEPSTFEQSVSLRHRVTIASGDQEFSFQSITEFREDRMVIVGLSSYSTTLFTIEVVEDEVRVQSKTDLPLNLEKFATDMQWVLWPDPPEIEGIRVESERNGSGFTRTIYRNGEYIGTVQAVKPPPESSKMTYRKQGGDTLRLKLLSSEDIPTNS